MLNIEDLTCCNRMSEPQTSNSGDNLPQHTKVSSGDNVADEDEENLERELLSETHESSSPDMYLLLQEMHTDMQSLKSRLDRIEQGQSNELCGDNNEVGCDTALAPKHGGRKRKLSEDASDDESVLMNKVLSNPADPAGKSAESISADTESLLSDIAQELSEQEPTGPAVNEDLAAILNQRWATKMSDKKLSDKLELIQRPENCSGLIVPRVNSEIWSNLDKFNKRRDLRTCNVQKNLAKVGSSLIYTTNKLLNSRQKGIQVNPAELIKTNMEIMAILGHAFVDLSHQRREAIKPSLNKEFAALCSEKVQVTANLFGDDLQTECNNIKTTNKLRQSALANKGRDNFDKRRSMQSSRHFSDHPQSQRSFLSKKKPWQNNKPWFPKGTSHKQRQ